MANWKDKNILIIGTARQGLALARFLSIKGAKVILNDKRDASELNAEIHSLKDFAVEWSLGHHDLSLLSNIDMLCVSGGIPLDLPIIEEAQKKGILLSNDSQIFLEESPAPVIGITGSAGKTTTTTLAGRMLQAQAQDSQKVWVGGNIGNPLINNLEDIQNDDFIIMELSSFQLEIMTRSPQISAILNVTPNHLDRHGTLQAYTAAKCKIYEFQSAEDITILGTDDSGACHLIDKLPGKLITFGRQKPETGQVGVYTNEDQVCIFDGSKAIPIMPISSIQLRGSHNILNVLGACAISYAAGANPEAMRKGVENFNGVEHRLEFVRTYKGAKWFNDSIATAPERTSAAINAFDGPLVLLLGGRDKDLPWQDLAKLIYQRADHVILFGEAANIIENALSLTQNINQRFSIQKAEKMKEAISMASEIVEKGDTVLLSPGGTSFDEFKDFAERGEYFKKWVKQLT
ncbi:MAG: UDP-N-acetylmuramoyl-L-alanine--D-glutamate ligase [Anaerolineaceae bacterium]|nr:UDP-N-acetylmuramoyl-L-alanine--D-glutamate ligase [Anaerolineaceae bacterium]